MDVLIEYYTKEFTGFHKTENVSELFAQFSSSMDLSPIESWLESQFKFGLMKNDRTAKSFRKRGMKHMCKLELLESLECCTKSLCFATRNGREFGFALASRSAVSFGMQEFESCLRDIDLCLTTNYPEDLKPLLYIRKAECYLETAQTEKLNECITETYNLLSKLNISNKGKYADRLKALSSTNAKPVFRDSNRDDLTKLPAFDADESCNFAHASSKIKLSFDESKGRHVVARKKIKKGDVLFIEKAFAFAPVFNEAKDFPPFKCYHCLKDVVSSIPCQTCTVCVYCDETCRTSSWNDCHRWECEGMQANIWYDLGIGLPAFRLLLKGVQSGLEVPKLSLQDNVEYFGSKDDHYRFFCGLSCYFHESERMASYLVASEILTVLHHHVATFRTARVIITYLEKYTEFFPWILEQEAFKGKDLNFMVNFVGVTILTNIGRVSCNSSIIEHWTYSSTDLLFPGGLVSLACGLFLSVAMMNHSCRPNITNFFIGDTIIVKALEDVPENEEILNCYGIDYRSMAREERRAACLRYNFSCRCVICEDPSKEMGTLDSYRCPKCNGLIPDASNDTSVASCLGCEKKYQLKTFRMINDESERYLRSEFDRVEPLTKCLDMRVRILNENHKALQEVYYGLYTYYGARGHPQNTYDVFQKWLSIERARKGRDCREVGIQLYEAALVLLHCIQTRRTKSEGKMSELLPLIDGMIGESKKIVDLYYPSYIISRLSGKLEISNR